MLDARYVDNDRLENLVRRHSSADSDDGEELYREFLKVARSGAWASYRCDDKEIICDAAADCWQAIDQFDPSRGKAYSFFRSVVRTSVRKSIDERTMHPKQFKRRSESVLAAVAGRFDGSRLSDIDLIQKLREADSGWRQIIDALLAEDFKLHKNRPQFRSLARKVGLNHKTVASRLREIAEYCANL